MARTYSPILVGVDVEQVEIETVVGKGYSGLHIIGLAGDASRDMRERVRSALESVGCEIPARRITVSLSPTAALRVMRTPPANLDFAVAACIFQALQHDAEGIPPAHGNGERSCEDALGDFTGDRYFTGELSLSGDLRPLESDLVPSLLAFKRKLTSPFCLPQVTSPVLTDCLPLPAWEFAHFSGWVDAFLNGEWPELRRGAQLKPSITEFTVSNISDTLISDTLISDTLTSASETCCLELLRELERTPARLAVACLAAAAGGHSLLVSGEPGVGKSHALSRLQRLLPNLSTEERLQGQLISGLPSQDCCARPMRTPHHTSTAAALIGGASLKPGEVTLAHTGLLFLDELAEFPRASLEALREPLDTGKVQLARAAGVIHYPARFLLVAATNPCPCGYVFSRKRACRCNPGDVHRYQTKISGPLLDRFCLQLHVSKDSHGTRSKLQVKQQGNLTSPPEADPFAKAWCNVIAAPANTKRFAAHFLEVQRARWPHHAQSVHQSRPPTLIHDTALAPLWPIALPDGLATHLGLSQRGEVALLGLAQTLGSLFPECTAQPETFFAGLHGYRELERLFANPYG